MSIKGFQIDGTVQRYDYTALDNKPSADATLSVSGGFADAAATGVVAAEIEDVRIGADGTEYASAGQAVRAQVNDLKSAIPAIDTTLSISGAPADAKAVGQAFLTALGRLEDDEALIDALDTRVTALEAGGGGDVPDADTTRY